MTLSRMVNLMRIRIFVYLLACSFLCGGSLWAVEYLKPNAQGPHSKAINDARKTVIAFICALYTQAGNSHEDQFINLGLKTGRRFMNWAAKNKDTSAKILISEVPMFWSFNWGPTQDFSLGKLFFSVTTDEQNRHLKGFEGEDLKLNKAIYFEEYACSTLRAD